MWDDRDLQILDLLQREGRTTNAELARQVGLAPSAVLERVRKLERQGVIRGYGAQLDPRALGHQLLAYVFVQADELPGSADVGAQLARVPEVQEVHHIAGEDCYLAKVRCASPEALGRLLKKSFGAVTGVRRTRSTVVLSTIKESAALAIPTTLAAGDGHDNP